MDSISYNELIIEPLSERHNLDVFCCTDDDLNDFLKNDALSNQELLINRTFVCIYKGRVIGFFSLLADTIKVVEMKKGKTNEEHPYREYPSMKIGRLAVDKRFERKNVGKYLILKICGAAFKIIQIIGVRFITVDSKEKSIKFYEKMGFIKTIKKKKYQTLYKDIYPVYLKLHSEDKKLDEFI